MVYLSCGQYVFSVAVYRDNVFVSCAKIVRLSIQFVFDHKGSEWVLGNQTVTYNLTFTITLIASSSCPSLQSHILQFPIFLCLLTFAVY